MMNAAKAVYRSRRGLTTADEARLERFKDGSNDSLRYENDEFIREVVLKGETHRTVAVVVSYFIWQETQEDIASKYLVAHTTVGRWLAGFRLRAKERAGEFALAF
jgi:hypothetical protein